MKLIIQLCIILTLLLSLSSYAENIMQLTGGNYIYAENGKLIFNLEPSIFKNRNWQHDPKTDTVITSFITRQLDFKTKHSSDFYAYETVFNTDPNHYASAYHTGYLVKPIFNPNDPRFHHQKVLLPVVIHGVRVGASLAYRWVVPKAIQWCFSNVNCSSLVVGGFISSCSLKYVFNLYLLPSGICEQAEKAGFSKNANDEYTKTSRYVVNYGSDHREKRYFETEEQAIAFAMKVSLEAVEKNKMKCLEQGVQRHQNSKISGAGCLRNSGGGSNIALISELEKPIEQTLQMVDLENFAVEDFKQHPNDYMNDKGELGTYLRGAIRTEKADLSLSSGGTVSFISSPYRDNQGQTKQDIVSIGAAQPSKNGKLSGDSNNPTAGISSSYNPTSVKSIDRPDLEGDSKPAENNHPNGDRTTTGSTSGQENAEKGKQHNHCENNPNSLGCTQLGDLKDTDKNPFGDSIGKLENGTSYSPDNFLPIHGTCPAPKIIVLHGKAYEMSYESFCRYSSMIRGIVISCAFVVAGFILFGKKST